jgi:tripartite-type tricarboxylate transporter receptor subunit TctC
LPRRRRFRPSSSRAPNYLVEAWFAVIGPKGLPAAEVQRAHAAGVEAFADPSVKEAMARQGNVINVGPVEQAMPFLSSELAKYAIQVRKAGVELQ